MSILICLLIFLYNAQYETCFHKPHLNTYKCNWVHLDFTSQLSLGLYGMAYLTWIWPCMALPSRFSSLASPRIHLSLACLTQVTSLACFLSAHEPVLLGITRPAFRSLSMAVGPHCIGNMMKSRAKSCGFYKQVGLHVELAMKLGSP